MGENSGIQWTHHTFNPWTRCTKVSPACDNCYAEDWAKRAKRPTGGLPIWGPDAPRDMTTDHNWRQPLRWNREAVQAGERRRVFCASLADVFEDHHVLAERDGERHARTRLWNLIEACRGLDWLLLTKRPENVKRMVPPRWLVTGAPDGSILGWPSHVWIGCTVENQEQADKRIPHLLRVPARVRFLSVEPQLEPIAWERFLNPGAVHPEWIIQGGESGPKARPFNIEWMYDTKARCADAGVVWFPKQMGSNATDARRDGSGRYRLSFRDSHGGDESEWPEDLRDCRAFPSVSS